MSFPRVIHERLRHLKGGVDDDPVINAFIVGGRESLRNYLKSHYPGEVCEGHGYCRCERVAEQNPELAAQLRAEEEDTEEKSLKGGAGSGNFGHAGRPGERGGSSSEGGGGNEISPAKFADLHGHSVTAVVRRMGKEGFTFTETRRYLNTVGLHGVNDATIRIQLGAGRNGQRGEPANLTQEQLTHISQLSGRDVNTEDLNDDKNKETQSTAEQLTVQDLEVTGPDNSTSQSESKDWYAEKVARADRTLARATDKGLKAFAKASTEHPQNVRIKGERMRAAMALTTERMSPGARIAAAKGLKAINFEGTTSGVNDKWVEAMGGKPQSGDYKDVVAAGFYSSDKKSMTVNGGSGVDTHQTEYGPLYTTAHIYAHEIGHAIDYHGLGKSHGFFNNHMSNQATWKKAFADEINRPNNPLSAYAKTNLKEGFAEYYRLVVHNPKVAEEKFPKAWKFFEKKGLTPPKKG